MTRHLKAGIGLVFSLAGVLVLGLAFPANAACGGATTKGAIGAIQFDTPVYGTRGDLYVNNFDDHQWFSWRQVGVVQNSNNFAEAGWQTKEALDQQAHPFKTWSNDGLNF